MTRAEIIYLPSTPLRPQRAIESTTTCQYPLLPHEVPTSAENYQIEQKKGG